MALDTISDDLILNILDWIWSEYDLIKLKIVCKRTRNLLEQYGCIRELNCCFHYSNMTNFIKTYIKNNRCLRVLHMCRIENPVIWIPCEWPQIVEFIGCSLYKNKVAPPRVSRTEELVIRDSCISRTNIENCKYSIKNPLWIDFRKLPNLKRVYIKTLSLDSNCLKFCKGLEIFELKLIPYWDRDCWKTTKINLPENFKKNVNKITLNCGRNKKFIL